MSKPPPIVEVEWTDAVSGSGWRTAEDSLAWIRDPCYCFASGYLVARDDKAITIATCWRTNNHTADLFQIPLPMITKIRIVRHGKIPFLTARKGGKDGHEKG
jgi:hypothetical protein